MPPKPKGGKGGKKKDDGGDKPRKEKRSKKKKEEVVEEPVDLEETQTIRPFEQVQGLEEKDLAELVERSNNANNPNAADNIARFNFSEKTFKFVPMIPQVSIHFDSEGYLIHKDSDEAKKQEALEDIIKENKKAALAEQKKQAEENEENGVDEGEDEDARELRNQFNFSERAMQTTNPTRKHRETMTDPPPAAEFGATATQWDIYDAYNGDLEKQRMEQERQNAKKKGKAKKTETAVKDKNDGEEDVIHSATMLRSMKIVERMVNQNSFDDITMDYKYWEDQSDEFRDTGTLLPLWQFFAAKVKKKHVTSICWNHKHPDLFAVGYGSYDFMKQPQTGGIVCCFTLKNPSAAEYTYQTESGVMCLDFHHSAASSLLAVGCYDGSVIVFDLGMKNKQPIFQSTVETGKHTDPVWQVKWQEEDLLKQLSFASISSDGRVTLWTMSKNELQYADIIHLKLVSGDNDDEELDDETALCGFAGGTCFDFNTFSDHLFVVGTEEGCIHKCSKAYNSQYLETYSGHNMNVYAVCWNKFHPNAFLSASADWTVKLWDHNMKDPLMSWDLNQAVGDVAWAPFSSTIFAAVTSDGKVHVFDLHAQKHEPLCEQKVIKKAKLTKVCFKPDEPILLVGDDRGYLTALKLSPNLRELTVVEEHLDPKTKELKPTPGDPDELKKWNKENYDAEVNKLDKLMKLAKNSEANTQM